MTKYYVVCVAQKKQIPGYERELLFHGNIHDYGNRWGDQWTNCKEWARQYTLAQALMAQRGAYRMPGGTEPEILEAMEGATAADYEDSLKKLLQLREQVVSKLTAEERRVLRLE